MNKSVTISWDDADLLRHLVQIAIQTFDPAAPEAALAEDVAAATALLGRVQAAMEKAEASSHDLRDKDGWPIVVLNDDGLRPAGLPDACFYCRAKLGTPHTRDCVTIQQRVKLRYSFDVEVSVPHHWDEQAILRHRNDSSWCADNAVAEIEGQQDACLCQLFTAEFIEVVDGKPSRELRSATHAEGIRRFRETMATGQPAEKERTQ